MRITSFCAQCTIDLGSGKTTPEDVFRDGSSVQALELQDSGLYRLTCGRGHETINCLQQMKFEILFDVGVNAIYDGYYHEAVACFASALERFYEFYLRVQCARQGNIADEMFTQAWKSVSRQSERQVGAFVFVHLLQVSLPPALLSGRFAEFRNDVVHKGKFPSRLEATEFGNQVASLIDGALIPLRRDFDVVVEKVVQEHLHRVQLAVPSGMQAATLSMLTMISVGRQLGEPTPSIEQWLGTIKVQRDLQRRIAGGAEGGRA